LNFKTTLLLGAVLIFGAGAVYFLDYKPTEEKKVDELLAKKLIKISADSISSMEITSAEGSFKLSKSPLGWYIVNPMLIETDESVIRGMIKSAEEIDKIRIITEGEDIDLSKYGLEPPQVSVNFTMSDSSISGYAIGHESPTGQFHFARSLDRTKIYTVSKTLWNRTRKNLSDLRNKKIITITNNEVQKVIIKTKGKKYDFDRISGGFKLVLPVELNLETRTHNQRKHLHF